MFCRAMFLVSLLLIGAEAQLRPRRVGTNALGEQEVVLTDVPSNGGGGGEAALGGGTGDALAEAMKALQASGMGGEGGFDLASMMKNIDFENNPMMKAMAQANPEMAKMLSDPEALQEQVAKMTEMMSSPEGQELAGNMVKEMQNIMTDPEKLKQGLQQLTSNPALKGLADAVPGLKEVLDDPAALDEQAEKAAELFQNLADPEKAKEMLGSLGGDGGGEVMEKLQAMLGGDGGGGLEEMQEAMQQMAAMMGGEGADFDGSGDAGGGGDALKERVRKQMAEMMGNKRRGALDVDEDEF